jgi:ribosomal protein S27E
MAKVYYVECPGCRKEYYLDKVLHQTVLSNPGQSLKCPFCKKEFFLETPPQKK